MPSPPSGEGRPGGTAILLLVRFEVVHSFEAAAEDVARALLDPRFQASLGDVGRLADRVVLSQEDDGGKVIRRTRCVLDIDIGGPAKAFVGDGDPAWIEVAEWDPDEMTWSWVIEPEVAAELLEAHGRTSIETEGKGSARRVVGEVKVRVPIYGGRVESKIAEELETSYQEEADRLTKWLTEHS